MRAIRIFILLGIIGLLAVSPAWAEVFEDFNSLIKAGDAVSMDTTWHAFTLTMSDPRDDIRIRVMSAAASANGLMVDNFSITDDAEITGACCFSDGSCIIATQAVCTAGGGSFRGAGTDCTPNPCPQPPQPGACCFPDGSCIIITQTGCTAAGGSFRGAGTDCSPNPCSQPTGACCFPDGSCTIRTQAGCTAAGGSFQGGGTDCSPNPCGHQVGACCHPDGSCTLSTQSDCAAFGGVYQGTGTSCSANPCGPPVLTIQFIEDRLMLRWTCPAVYHSFRVYGQHGESAPVLLSSVIVPEYDASSLLSGTDPQRWTFYVVWVW